MYLGNDGSHQGIFYDILHRFTNFLCTLDGKPYSRMDFTSNGKNGLAKKTSVVNMKRDIDDFVHMTFPIYNFKEMHTYLEKYSYVPVLDHPGVVFFIVLEDIKQQVWATLTAIGQTWPILCVNLLILGIAGVLLWTLVS